MLNRKLTLKRLMFGCVPGRAPKCFNRKVTLTRLMSGCMLGRAPKCLTARWSPKDVYFRNATRVKPSPRTRSEKAATTNLPLRSPPF